MKVEKDSKGDCWIISHRRCGVTECIFVTIEELFVLAFESRKILDEWRKL